MAFAPPLLVRGIGPRPEAFGVTGTLVDPRVDPFSNESGRSALFASNDNWAETGAAPVRAGGNFGEELLGGA